MPSWPSSRAFATRALGRGQQLQHSRRAHATWQRGRGFEYRWVLDFLQHSGRANASIQRGHGFESSQELGLFSTLSYHQCALNQIPCGGATLLTLCLCAYNNLDGRPWPVSSTYFLPSSSSLSVCCSPSIWSLEILSQYFLVVTPCFGRVRLSMNPCLKKRSPKLIHQGLFAPILTVNQPGGCTIKLYGFLFYGKGENVRSAVL